MEAKALSDLETILTAELARVTALLNNPPFSSVRVWEWNSNALSIPGGQHRLVEPALDRANMAVFVFKERIGSVTWEELTRVRQRTDPTIPILAMFPNEPPALDKLKNRESAKEWYELLERREELTSEWNSTTSLSLRPLEEYKNIEHLKEIVLEQFRATLTYIIASAQSDGGVRHLAKQVQYTSSTFLDGLTIVRQHSPRAVELFRRNLRPSQRIPYSTTMSDGMFLEDLGALRLEHLTKGGVLLFTETPDNELPGAYVQVTLFQGQSKSSSILRREEIRGPLLEQLERTLILIKAFLSYEGQPSGKMRSENSFGYPELCLREVLANALCHRSYEDAQRHTHVRIFQNRIEVLSPGGWAGSIQVPENQAVSIEKLCCEPVSRNHSLAKLLGYVNFVETQGRGILAAINDCKNSGADFPLVKEEGGYVIVIIRPLGGLQYDWMVGKGITPTSLGMSEKHYMEMVSKAGSSRQTLVKKIRRRRPELALSLLPEVTDLNPINAVDFVLETRGWTGHDLYRVLKALIERGASRAELATRVLDRSRSKCTTKELGCLLYAADCSGLEISDEQFFRACRRPGPVANEWNIKTVRIPPEDEILRFWFGSSEEKQFDKNVSNRLVSLQPFKMGVTTVTEEQYSYFEPECVGRRTTPIVNVTWWEAWLFCRWLGGSLPTEAQWEAACRAGTTTPWYIGSDVENLSSICWYGEDEEEAGYPHPVAQKAPNAWGLYDMHGNVWEWCLDKYDESVNREWNDSWEPKERKKRILRGGSVISTSEMTTSSSRYLADPSKPSLTTGFRICLPILE